MSIYTRRVALHQYDAAGTQLLAKVPVLEEWVLRDLLLVNGHIPEASQFNVYLVTPGLVATIYLETLASATSRHLELRVGLNPGDELWCAVGQSNNQVAATAYVFPRG